MRAIKQINGVWRCLACGDASPDQSVPHAGKCSCYGVPGKAPKGKPGLGDMVSAGLAAVGITPERVSKVLGRPCGCKERAAKLNELGRRIGIG